MPTLRVERLGLYVFSYESWWMGEMYRNRSQGMSGTCRVSFRARVLSMVHRG